MRVTFYSIKLQKVNSQLKRSDNELAKLNSIMEQISAEEQRFAPSIAIEVTASPKKSQSPLLRKLRPQQLQGKVTLPSFLRSPSHNASSGAAGLKAPASEARPEGISEQSQPS